MSFNIDLHEFEVMKMLLSKNKSPKMTDLEIDSKYEKGELRIVTEQGSFKLDLINSIFAQDKPELFTAMR